MPTLRLSAILVTEEGGSGLDRILSCLASQTCADGLDVVIAAAEPAALSIRPEHERAFGRFRILAADTTTSATARVTAIAAAATPYVALVEDHSFPRTDLWATRLLAGLDAGHACVGPRMVNANPRTRTSRANLAVEYAPWMHGGEARKVDFLPGHNSAYRRDLLLGYGTELGDLLEAEWTLHADLRRRGHRLLFDPQIEVAHLNYARLRRSLRLQLLSGRMFAASRARSWGPARRLFFFLAAPALPVTRLARIVRHMRAAAADRADAIEALPHTFLILVASGAGEALGYLLGDGGRRRALARMEYRRWRNLLPEEEHLAR